MSKYPIETGKNAYLYRMEKEMKYQGITGLHATFDDKEKAIEMCGIDGYLILGKD